jgi:hypothetical protein
LCGHHSLVIVQIEKVSLPGTAALLFCRSINDEEKCAFTLTSGVNVVSNLFLIVSVLEHSHGLLPVSRLSDKTGAPDDDEMKFYNIDDWFCYFVIKTPISTNFPGLKDQTSLWVSV